MSKRQANKLRDGDIVGLKYFDRLMPLLKRLHGVGAQRDRAGNRQLFFDHYCAYLLLFLFNPVVTSLRGIQQASELKKYRRNCEPRFRGDGLAKEFTGPPPGAIRQNNPHGNLDLAYVFYRLPLVIVIGSL